MCASSSGAIMRDLQCFSREQTFFRGNRRFFAGTDVFSREQTCSNSEVTDGFRRRTIAGIIEIYRLESCVSHIIF